jgi:hypothetical protein
LFFFLPLLIGTFGGISHGISDFCNPAGDLETSYVIFGDIYSDDYGRCITGLEMMLALEGSVTPNGLPSLTAKTTDDGIRAVCVTLRDDACNPRLQRRQVLRQKPR